MKQWYECYAFVFWTILGINIHSPNNTWRTNMNKKQLNVFIVPILIQAISIIYNKLYKWVKDMNRQWFHIFFCFVLTWRSIQTYHHNNTHTWDFTSFSVKENKFPWSTKFSAAAKLLIILNYFNKNPIYLRNINFHFILLLTVL